ncbi:putative reverse transcriptase domain-containing protein [Tanacetum coccineum]|uniref:Reverse transcriptase domain-containing protein n=1 Tax=Tanacetum coccineum TaxID=301880 RepID=A0ABQ4WUG8_9ASTR
MTFMPRTRIRSCTVGGVWIELLIRAKVIENTIMAASAIAISSDSSDESVGSPPSRVILFAPVFHLPLLWLRRLLSLHPLDCGLIPYSDSDSDSPDEMSSPEHISLLPAISPFLCTDSSEAPDSSDGPPSQDPYVATVARWRSRVTTRPSSSSEFPIALITAPPGNRSTGQRFLFRTQGLSFCRLYRTHLNGRVKLLTVRKRVDLIPARRLDIEACYHLVFRPSAHLSSSSSRILLPVHFSLGLGCIKNQGGGEISTFWISTRDVSLDWVSSGSAPHVREAFRLGVLLHYILFVPSSTPVIGSLAPTVMLIILPPRKRFRDSYSSKASIRRRIRDFDPIETEVDMVLGIGDGDDVRNHVDIDPRDVRDETEGYEADTSARDTIEVGIDPMSAPIVEEEIVEPAGEDSSEFVGTWDALLGHSMDMQMTWMMLCMTFTITCLCLRLENLKVRDMLDIKRDRVNSLRLHVSLSQEEFRQVYKDRDDTRGRLRRPLDVVSLDENGRGVVLLDESTYRPHGSGQPSTLMGTEGVVGLIRWLKKMETVFHISNCPEKSQVKYATCTLLDSALTWWNSHKRTIGTEAVFAMSWRELVKLMTKRFQELTMMCTKMVPEEEDRVEKFIGGLPDNIQGNVIAAEPTRLQDVVRIANNLMDQKLKCGAQGHYQKDCPKVKNQNRENKARVPDARGRAYVLGGGDANPGSNTVTDVSYACERAVEETLETTLCLEACH